jgi:hypothetical protein
MFTSSYLKKSKLNPMFTYFFYNYFRVISLMTDNMVPILARATRTKSMSIIFFIRRYFNLVINKKMIF